MEALILIPSSPTLSLSLSLSQSLILKTRRPSPPSSSLSISLSSSASSFFNRTLSSNIGNISSSYGAVQIRNQSRRRRRGMLCTCLFGLGVPELVVIAGVATLLFGPKKLPEVGRSIGKTIKGFQQAAKEFESELKKEPDTAIESPPEKPAPTGEGKEEI